MANPFFVLQAEWPAVFEAATRAAAAANPDPRTYGVGVADQLNRARTESEGLGLFVRSLVGLDREAAKEAVAGFLAQDPDANQIEFVNLIVDHLTEHGVMDARLRPWSTSGQLRRPREGPQRDVPRSVA